MHVTQQHMHLACTLTNAMCPQVAYNGGDTLQQGSTLNAPGKVAGISSSENMTNSCGTSQRAPSSEALRSSSSASSLALQGPAEGATRGGQAESSGRGWADLSGDMQQRLNLGQGQQARRSSDSFASIPRVYSNERLAPGVLDTPRHLLLFFECPFDSIPFFRFRFQTNTTCRHNHLKPCLKLPVPGEHLPFGCAA